MDSVLRASGLSPILSMLDLPYGTVQWPMAATAPEKHVPEPNGNDQAVKEEGTTVWGDLMHPGFYEPGACASVAGQYRLAQVRMLEETLSFAQITDDALKQPKKILGIGCGLGDSWRYLAKKSGSIISMLVQARGAQDFTSVNRLGDKVSFQVADILDQSLPKGQFDLVLSMGSGHMRDKEKFVTEMDRVAALGATIIILTWCHRGLCSDEYSLKADEKALLNKICSAYDLPEWCSASDYVRIAQSLGLKVVKTATWSDHVTPFWPAVIRYALTWRGFTSLLQSGWKTMRGALAIPLMMEGCNRKLIELTIITCCKPK